MAKFVETITNIFKIEELKKRIIYTLLLVLVYRLGCYIILPGLDPEVLKGGISGTQEGLVGLLNMFSGGAFGNASIFALGVMPYISASIVVQLLGMFVPSFRKMQMEGESGRRKMNQITRYLTIAILAIQGPAYVTGMIPRNAIAVGWSSFVFNLVSTVILMAGTMFVMWLGERITDRGIGNGISLIIMIGIVARLPYALVAEFGQKFSGNGVGGPLILVVELVIWFLVIIAAIAIVQAVRKVPVQYAKRVIGNKQYGPDDVPDAPGPLGCHPWHRRRLLELYELLVQSRVRIPGDRVHLLLHRRDRQPDDDGRGYEEERRLHPGRQAGQADRQLHRHDHVPDHPSGLHRAGVHRHHACVREHLRHQQPVCQLLRRHLPPHHGGCGPRHAAAD